MRNQRCAVCDFRRVDSTNKLTRRTLITNFFVSGGVKGLNGGSQTPSPKNVEQGIYKYIARGKKYCIFYDKNLPITKCTRPTSHTSKTVDNLNKSKFWTCNCVHDGSVIGSLVMAAVMPLSSSMYDGEFDQGGGGGGGGVPAAAAAAAVAAVAAVDDDWRQKRPASRASTVA